MQKTDHSLSSLSPGHTAQAGHENHTAGQAVVLLHS
jgi:hypothetical protein